MRIKACLCLLFLAGTGLLGCSTASTSDTHDAPGVAVPAQDKPMAYVQGQTVRLSDLTPMLIEAAGGSTLSQWVLTGQLREALRQQGLTVTAAQIKAERQRMLDTLDPSNPDRAVRLLNVLRDQRGLGATRFDNLLWCNAALGLLIEDQVVVSAAGIEQAYQLHYGPRYQVRILVAESLADANQLRERIVAGENFSDLAAAYSTDLSAAQGGLLSPISPVDATYPRVVRDAMVQTPPSQVSDVFILDHGYGFLQVQRKVDAAKVDLSEVHEALEQQVRQQVKRLLMQQTARALLSEADVVVLDPALAESWRQQKDRHSPSPGPGGP